MTAARTDAINPALLSNGKVLVAGGFVNSSVTNTAELYDPLTGTWTSTATMSVGHYSDTATFMPDGTVLVAGYSNAELFNVGLGATNSWRPQIATVTSPFYLGGSLVLGGSGFRGISGASGGHDSQNSPTDYPVVQLYSLNSAQTLFLIGTNWSATSFVSAPVTGFATGYALATVFANGIPSAATIFNISGPLPVPFILTNSTESPGGVFQCGFTNTPGAAFTGLTTTNLSLALSNWTVLPAGVVESSSGHFQFTDSHATNGPQRFYRVRSP
jgi:hypothetical protein